MWGRCLLVYGTLPLATPAADAARQTASCEPLVRAYEAAIRQPRRVRTSDGVVTEVDSPDRSRTVVGATDTVVVGPQVYFREAGGAWELLGDDPVGGGLAPSNLLQGELALLAGTLREQPSPGSAWQRGISSWG